jgi:hypothetical protein
MNITIQTAVVLALISSSTAHARQAVQWTAADGGNGHWYGLRLVTEGLTWHDASNRASVVGGHLATCENSAERSFINQRFAPENAAGGWFPQGGSGSCPLFGPWIGGFQDPGATDFSEPYGGWRWLTGTQFDPHDNFCCNNACAGQSENCLQLYRGCGNPYVSWNDLSDDSSACGGRPSSYIVEWDADCNGDGVVDYGQLLSGHLADTNSDGIPDTCQCGTIPSLPGCCPGDLDHDSTVGGADIGLLLSNWGPCGSSCPYDLNTDGKVNGGDLGLLLAGWGPCTN